MLPASISLLRITRAAKSAAGAAGATDAPVVGGTVDATGGAPSSSAKARGMITRGSGAGVCNCSSASVWPWADSLGAVLQRQVFRCCISIRREAVRSKAARRRSPAYSAVAARRRADQVDVAVVELVDQVSRSAAPGRRCAR